MKKLMILALGLTLSSTAVMASDADIVEARQAAMKTIGQNMKALGTMAKGAMPFDAAVANASAAAIAAEAAKISALFETQAHTGDDEALPAIWENYADFTAKGEALASAASSVSIASKEDLGAAMGQIGGSCKACHSKYKK
ncbi:MAG: c-type cytochrome [Mangrovicoccus sp.]